MSTAFNSIKRGLTQSEAAEIFGVTQARISDLVRGKMELFSRVTLIGMAATAAGRSPDPCIHL